jgi:hypothetical protein
VCKFDPGSFVWELLAIETPPEGSGRVCRLSMKFSKFLLETRISKIALVSSPNLLWILFSTQAPI